jgi:hypothetical protein
MIAYILHRASDMVSAFDMDLWFFRTFYSASTAPFYQSRGFHVLLRGPFPSTVRRVMRCHRSPPYSKFKSTFARWRRPGGGMNTDRQHPEVYRTTSIHDNDSKWNPNDTKRCTTRTQSGGAKSTKKGAAGWCVCVAVGYYNDCR